MAGPDREMTQSTSGSAVIVPDWLLNLAAGHLPRPMPETAGTRAILDRVASRTMR